MQWALTRLALQAARRTWLHLGGPRGSKIEAKTLKNRCWKTTRFQHRFWKGSDLVLEGFLVGFSNRKCMQKAMWRKVSDKQSVLEKPIRNRCRHFCNIAFFEPKSMKNRMSLGTSILKAFWEGFGRGLGAQNPRFSHFFRCFFEAFFEQRFGRPTNRKKTPNIGTLTDFWVGLAECAASGERLWEGGEGLRCRRYRKAFGYRSI